jgi:hypothetical protein
MERLGAAIRSIPMPWLLRTVLASAHALAGHQFAIDRTAHGCLTLSAMDYVVAAANGRGLAPADVATLRGLIGEARDENGCR